MVIMMCNSKYKVLEQLEYDCPFCNRTHVLECRSRMTQAIIKKEIVSFNEIYYYCPYSTDDENEFVPAGLNDENLLRARNAYRQIKGLLTSREISEIRKKYGMTQNEFSSLLGWGDVTITRYETKLIQDETYDKLMRMVGENPGFALESLMQHKDDFSAKRFQELKRNIQSELKKTGSSFFVKQEILSQYAAYDEPCNENGFQLLDIDKLGDMMSYFANRVRNLYKVRLMKLLWFSDALAFSRRGKAISGLVYQHAQYGALPLAAQRIIYLPSIFVTEEETASEQIKYHISAVNSDIAYLSEEEVLILDEVADRFKHVQTEDIIKCMHSEDAYIKTRMYDIIPFSLCKKLLAF